MKSYPRKSASLKKILFITFFALVLSTVYISYVSATVEICNDGIDNDGDGLVDSLVNLDTNNGLTTKWYADTVGIRSFLNQKAKEFGYRTIPTAYNGQGMVNNDATTAKKVCNLAGYKDVKYQDCREHGTSGRCTFSSPHDNKMGYWSTSANNIIITGASGHNWLASLTCVNKLPQCSDGIDNDKDGKIDMKDPGCQNPNDNDERTHDPDCMPIEVCNGIDDNLDGRIDENNGDCSSEQMCVNGKCMDMECYCDSDCREDYYGDDYCLVENATDFTVESKNSQYITDDKSCKYYAGENSVLNSNVNSEKPWYDVTDTFCDNTCDDCDSFNFIDLKQDSETLYFDSEYSEGDHSCVYTCPKDYALAEVYSEEPTSNDCNSYSCKYIGNNGEQIVKLGEYSSGDHSCVYSCPDGYGLQYFNAERPYNTLTNNWCEGTCNDCDSFTCQKISLNNNNNNKNGVYHDLHEFTCEDNECVEKIFKKLVEECDNGCSNGKCLLSCKKEGETIPVIPNPPVCCNGLILIPPKDPLTLGIAGICTSKCGNGICDSSNESNYNCPQDCPVTYNCSNNSDCGTDGYIGNSFCKNDSNDVFQKYITYTCNNPGTCHSSCSSSETIKLKEACNCFGKCHEGTCVKKCVDNDLDSYDNCNPGEIFDDGNPIDCDDNNSSIHPDAVELCNGIDDNCNGRVDEGCGCDSIPPAVDLISPVTGTIFTGNNAEVNFLFNVVEESGIKSCQVNINNNSYQNTTEISKTSSNSIKVNLTQGSYNAYVSCKDEFNNIGDSQVINFSVSQDECSNDHTAPGKITDIRVSSVGKNYILWKWVNPNDPDFSKNIIILDGVNVINTTDNEYKATNLESDESYTIKIKTMDKCGNINNNEVTKTATTKKSSTGGVVINDYYPEDIIYQDTSIELNQSNQTQENEEVIILIKPTQVKKSVFTFNWLLWLLVIIFLILLILLIIFIIKSVSG
jgi:hypothetical protein